MPKILTKLSLSCKKTIHECKSLQKNIGTKSAKYLFFGKKVKKNY